MIVDVHSHTWRYPEHFTDDFREQAKKARRDVEVNLSVRFVDYAGELSGGRGGAHDCVRRQGAAFWIVGG